MVLRETFWTEEQPTTSPQERELQKAERWAEVEGGGERRKDAERERLKEELRQAAVRRKFRVSTAFYWLTGKWPGMMLKDATEIVDELRQLDGHEYPFMD